MDDQKPQRSAPSHPEARSRGQRVRPFAWLLLVVVCAVIGWYVLSRREAGHPDADTVNPTAPVTARPGHVGRNRTPQPQRTPNPTDAASPTNPGNEVATLAVSPIRTGPRAR